MPEALSIYETLPQTAKQEVNDFIFFVAARINYAKASKKDSSQGLTALNNLKKFRGRIPSNFDAKKNWPQQGMKNIKDFEKSKVKAILPDKFIQQLPE